MKTMRNLFLGLIISLGIHSTAYSQLSPSEFLMGGVGDAEKLFQEYLKPYANIFGANLNAGWYNTGKPHKFGGFDITITANVSSAPSADLVFDPTKLGLSSDASISGGNQSPTIAGQKTPSRPTINYSKTAPAPIGKVPYGSATLPDGTGIKMLPLPMAQLGIGLPFGTDVTVRYFPKLDLGDMGNVGLWGVGLKHSIIQWIPALKRLPILDISAQGGYTKFNTSANIHFGPSKISSSVVDYVNDPNVWEGQKLELGITAWTANLLFSQTLPVITFYQAIGYSSSSVNFGLTGNYPFTSIETNASSPYYGDVVVNNIQGQGIVADPISLEMQNNKDLRLNAGVRIKLAIITIHFDYTKANYSAFTAGLGISFR